MNNDFKVHKFDRVLVRHERGSEWGTAFENAKAHQNVLVRFEDGTFSAWPMSNIVDIRPEAI